MVTTSILRSFLRELVGKWYAWVGLGLVLLAVVGIILGVITYRSVASGTTTQTASGQSGQKGDELSDLIARVSRHALMPEGETPTLGEVSDAGRLSHLDFFERALDGDKVLLYPKAGRAFLYRPAIDRVIEVAPYAESSQPSPTGPAQETSQ